MSEKLDKVATDYVVPVEVITGLARGEISHREAFGATGDSIESVARYGHKLLETEHYEEARTVFDGLVALDPDVAYFHLGLGTALRNLGEREAAVAEYDKAKDLDPADFTSDLNRAQMLIEDGDAEGARKLMEGARDAVSVKGHPLSEAFQQIWTRHFEPA